MLHATSSILSSFRGFSFYFLPWVAVLAVPLAFSLQTPSPPDPQKLWALVVGISNYAHAEPLRFAALDAESFADFLSSPRGGGIPPEHIFSLLEDQATRSKVILELKAMRKRVQPGDSVYVYIAGHGFLTESGIGYFMPSDGDVDEPDVTGVHLGQLKDLIELGLAHADRRILVTDMCNAGRIGPGQSERATKIQNIINEDLLKLGGGRPGSFLNLLASRPTEASWENEELGRGVFTHALLEALNGKTTGQESPVVSAKHVVDYLRSEVPSYTANTQHPMYNEDYDPNLPLSFVDKPGPPPKATAEAVVLEIVNADKSAYSRVQWVDPKTSSTAVRLLPRDKDMVKISSLAPGDLQFVFYDVENRSRSVNLKIERGKNTLDLTKASLTRNSSGPRLVRFLRAAGRWAQSLRPAAPTQGVSWSSLVPATGLAAPFAEAARTAGGFAATTSAQTQAAATADSGEEEAALLMRLDSGTQVYVDGSPFGTGSGGDRFLQLQGLNPGYHQLTLVPSVEREHRFRIKLFQGAQIFDLTTGEVRAVAEIQPPPEVQGLPSGLPAGLADDYRRFQRALWEERLQAPPGDSAWDYYQRLQTALPATLQETLKNQLIVAMGDQAQRTILKYLRGGDLKWNANLFDQGATLLDRVQQLFEATSYFEAQERFFTGRALIERGDYIRAVPELQRAVALNPQASYAYNALGLALWKQNRLQEAIQPLQQSIRLTPTWTYPRNTLALIYLEQRRYAEAEQAFQTSIQLNADDSAAYHGSGQINLLSGRFQEAETQLRRAVEVNPGNAYAYETLGKLYQRQQRGDQAEQMFRLAIRLEPDEPSFILSLAELLQQIGRVQEAQPLLSRVVERNPSSLPALQAYAGFLTAQNNLAEANRLFQQAFRLSPDDSNLHVAYGLFFQKQGRNGDAEKEFRTALRIQPANTFAHYNLAAIHVSQQKIADAEKELAQAAAADPRFAKTPLLLGQIRLAQKRYAEALEQYRKALELSIETAQQQEIQGYIEVAEGAVTRDKLEQASARVSGRDYKGAWALYAEALKSAPDHRPLRDAIVQFQREHPEEADVSMLPASQLSHVLKTTFWKSRQLADELWQKGQSAQATETLLSAVEKLSPAERSVVTATSFNIGNQLSGIHQTIYTWASRLLEGKEYARAAGLMDVAIRQNIYAVVPDFSPITVDALMTPADAVNPTKFSDFEVAHHPDRRAHEVYAVALAGMGNVARARQYLPALETARPDLAVRLRIAKTVQQQDGEQATAILQEIVHHPELVSEPELLAAAFVLLAEIQCQAGDCAAGRATLESGLKTLPDNQPIKEAIRKLRN